MPVLRETSAGEPRTARRRRFSLSQMLVVSQLAISMLLLLAAALFVRTLSNLQSLETGFRRENVLVFKVNARQAGHRDAEILSFYDDLEKRFAAIAGVRSAGMANSPLIGDGAWGWPVVPAGQEPPADPPSGHGSGFGETATHVLATAPGFFTTMGIPLLAGRAFDERDRLGSPPVAMVNQAWVNVNLKGRNPVGLRVTSLGPGLPPREMQIVGLVKNARYDDLTGNFPAIVYMPLAQNLNVPVAEMTFFLRTAGDPLAYANAVREMMHEADARVPVTNLATQAAQVDRETIPQRMFARLCAGFAALALAIACVGLYGTVAYTVARRTGEIGIRMALGAQRSAVVSMVLRDALILTAAGLAIGVPVALGAAKLIASLLYGVKPGDPAAMLAAVGILIGAALAAGYVPARNASRIDPLTAVRHE
jgi:predicted permease